MQQELIEMLEEIVQYVEVWNAHDQSVLDKAEALIEKAKDTAPAPPLELTDSSIDRIVYEHTKLNPNQGADRALLTGIRHAVRDIIAALRAKEISCEQA